MMKCVEHGHELVALANLHPADGTLREIDSFMYQSVGSDLVPLLALALGLPLFTAPITGSAKAVGLEYTQAEGDEVEDLYRLLSRARDQLPFDAVCSGAILSNYQRSRVEHVCARLGLDSLAFLWQREQSVLLAEMVAAGVEAVLVKVASLGLGASQLHRSIAELQPLFAKLHARFGFHPCGEGGEYETFTLDCPLFKKRLELIGAHPLVHSEDLSGMAPVVLLVADRAQLVEKEPQDAPEPSGPDAWWATERRAAAAEAEAKELEIALMEEGDANRELAKDGDTLQLAARSGTESADASPGWVLTEAPQTHPGHLTREHADWSILDAGVECRLVFVPQHSGLAGVEANSEDDEVAAVAQVTAALSALPGALAMAGLEPSQLLYVRLYTGDMRHYKKINEAYGRLMKDSPAARACVQIPLRCLSMSGFDTLGVAVERDCRAVQSFPHIGIEALASRLPKRYLHVSSISEWAPRMVSCCE
eukprot:scaffold266423_cov33-Tisochrysis_lutea.AAC.1